MFGSLGSLTTGKYWTRGLGLRGVQLAGLAADVVFWAWWGGHSSDSETWRHCVCVVGMRFES